MSTYDPIPITEPFISDLEVKMAAEAAQFGWGANHYKFNRDFEDLFSKYLGIKHAVSLPNATAGLHLACAAFGIGPGDEVICPDVTWIASVAPVIYQGATPVFVEIDPITWCIDPASGVRAITPRTKGIIAVDLYGSLCDWKTLRKIAMDYGIFLIEDAAEALGGHIAGKKAGTFGDIGVFSFHGTKMITTGEGGMVVTDSTPLYETILTLRDHGRAPGDTAFYNQRVGYKYKMSALQAGFGIAQIKRIDEIFAEKIRVFKTYKQLLDQKLGIVLNFDQGDFDPSYWMVTVIPPCTFKIKKSIFQEEMKTQGIDTRPFFSRLSYMPAFDGHDIVQVNCRSIVVDHIVDTAINLPSGPTLTKTQISYVSQKVNTFISEAIKN